ncbi:MAG: acyl-CoA dehydrogenase family protein, partial [Streptosporangiaceae bacterium]|nr:acyl-CoA dehydrogenase family protein [Streptosporangiaceae bacterium]
LLGLLIPEEHGGSGGDQLAVALLAEELARASGGIAVSPLVSAYMAAPHIVAYGSAGQRAAYLPALARGDSVAAIAVTEPAAGSDVAAITTSAVRDGAGWRLTGRKMFITNAGPASVLIVAAKTAPDAGRRGISTFLVDAPAPGLSFGEPLPKLGWHAADTREVILDEVAVPATAVLGELNRGFYQVMHAFQLERIALAAMGLGHAAECLRLATGHARTREAFGAPLTGLQSVRHKLAVMAVELEAARLMTYRAAQRLGAGHPQAARSVAMAKYHTALAAGRIVDAAVQIFGGSGYLEESAVARHYRDVRVLRIGGGADEIQLEILSRELTPMKQAAC